jgi:hypothetical protein
MLADLRWSYKMRVSIILVYASLETALAFMNHFPLFALMLRVKDPQRSPGKCDRDCSMYVLKEGSGGIYMRVEPSKDGDDVEVCLEVGRNLSVQCLPDSVVQSHPLPLIVTFVQYGASPLGCQQNYVSNTKDSRAVEAIGKALSSVSSRMVCHVGSSS